MALFQELDFTKESFVVDLLFFVAKISVGGFRRARTCCLWGLRLFEGVFLRGRQCRLWCLQVPRSQPGLQTLMRSSPTRGRRLGCCWNVEVSFWVESFDVNGGALVLLERRSAGRGCCPGVALPRGTGRSLRLRDQYPIGPGRSLRLRDSSPGQSRKLSRPGRSRPVGAGAGYR